MNRKARRWGGAALIAGMGMVVAFTRPETATTQLAGTAPVTVMNTPLPVALQGTGSITGNVNAAQSGPWSVGVTTLPAVQLAAGTTVAINGGSVAFDDPARQAYVVELCAAYDDECSPGASETTLPVGTRFVIEQASGYCKVINLAIDGWEVKARLNGQNHSYEIRDKISADDDESTNGLFFEQTRIYADGGGVNGLSVQLIEPHSGETHTFGPHASCKITLSGYLVQTSPAFPATP